MICYEKEHLYITQSRKTSSFIIQWCEDPRKWMHSTMLCVITNTQDIVHFFNSFFSFIGPKLATTIRQTPAHDYKKDLTRIINSSFPFKETTPENVTKMINNFLPKSSCGHDGLSMKLIKSLKEYLSRPLSLVINQSFCTGIFPDIGLTHILLLLFHMAISWVSLTDILLNVIYEIAMFVGWAVIFRNYTYWRQRICNKMWLKYKSRLNCFLCTLKVPLLYLS